jgi:hypothetical protein
VQIAAVCREHNCAQSWAEAHDGGRPKKSAPESTFPKSGNVAGLDRVADRVAQSGASHRTQQMADKVVAGKRCQCPGNFILGGGEMLPHPLLGLSK